MEENIHILGSSAIKRPEDDLFNFRHYAEKVKFLIQHNADNPDPITIGIYGKWGEGKTSFLNLVEHQIDIFSSVNKKKGIIKYHFNPWRYSKEDEMLFDFFDGLAKAMSIKTGGKLNKVGDAIIRFSRYLKSVKLSSTIGIPFLSENKLTLEPDKIFEALGEDLKGQKITIDSLRTKVNELLDEANFKIIVFIDDLDRLDKDEIYTILKLIKLNANFREFIYIVTLDNKQIAKAISKRYGSNKKDGELFLEKIINIPIHVPRIEEFDLKHFFELKLKQVKESLNFIDEERKKNEFDEISYKFSRNYFNSPRDVLRVLNSFFVGAFSIGNEVNLNDLFWIEYIKIKNEGCYNLLKNYKLSSEIIGVDNEFIDFNDGRYKEGSEVKGTRDKIFKDFNDVSDIIKFLFPTMGNFTFREPDKGKMKSEIRVNVKEEYEKYFSFHVLRKVSKLKLFELENNINKKEKVKLESIIKELYQNHEEYKITSILMEQIKSSKIDSRDFLCDFLVSNLSLIPNSEKDISGRDNKLLIVELIAYALDSDSQSDNEKIITNLSNKLDVRALCHFERKIHGTRTYKETVQEILVKKIPNLIKREKPFYKNSLDPTNRSIMFYWNKHDREGFQVYIKNQINTMESIKSLIRCFPTYWNNSFFGALEKSNYDFMKSLVDVNYIFKKIKKYDSKLIESINIDKFQLDEREENTMDQNLEQFIYWYKKENNLP